MRRRPLPRGFYGQDTVTVARALLGCVVQRKIGAQLLRARIVETEAYLGANDPASHARRGLRSERNESMYLRGGHAYVYFTYGMHYCMNVVTQDEDVAEAVLVRAAEPVEGIEVMRANRPKTRRETDLLSGPGKLCMALGIDRGLDGVSLAGEELSIAPRESPVDENEIAISPRIGIEGAAEAVAWPLRFFLAGNPHVSRARWAPRPAPRRRVNRRTT